LVDTTIKLTQATATIESLTAPAMVQEITVATENPTAAAKGLQVENPERAMSSPDTATEVPVPVPVPVCKPCDQHNEVSTSPSESESEAMSDADEVT
jgi:hypothetical protein